MAFCLCIIWWCAVCCCQAHLSLQNITLLPFSGFSECPNKITVHYVKILTKSKVNVKLSMCMPWRHVEEWSLSTPWGRSYLCPLNGMHLNPNALKIWCWAGSVIPTSSIQIVWNIFYVCHPEVCNTYINIQWCISQAQENFIMFIIVLG